MDFLEQNALGIVVGVVVYMICLNGIGVGQILEKWFGSSVHKYEPEITFAQVVIVFVLFAAFSKPNLNNVQSDTTWIAFFVSLTCAVIHKLIILRGHEKAS